jgi:hypothetical protein
MYFVGQTDWIFLKFDRRKVCVDAIADPGQMNQTRDQLRPPLVAGLQLFEHLVERQ